MTPDAANTPHAELLAILEVEIDDVVEALQRARSTIELLKALDAAA